MEILSCWYPRCINYKDASGDILIYVTDSWKKEFDIKFLDWRKFNRSWYSVKKMEKWGS